MKRKVANYIRNIIFSFTFIYIMTVSVLGFDNANMVAKTFIKGLLNSIR